MKEYELSFDGCGRGGWEGASASGTRRRSVKDALFAKAAHARLRADYGDAPVQIHERHRYAAEYTLSRLLVDACRPWVFERETDAIETVTMTERLLSGAAMPLRGQ